MNTTGTSAPGSVRAHRHVHHQPTHLVLAAGLVLLAIAACGTPSVPAGSDARRLAGTATPWTGEPAVATAYSDFGSPALASGPIASSGAFSILLPETLDVGLLDTIPPCPAVPVEPASARGAFVSILDVTAEADGRAIGTLVLTNNDQPFVYPNVDDAVAIRLYVDRDARIHGTCVEDSGYEVATFTYALTLLRGWNVVTARLTAATATERTLELRSGPPAADLTWRYVADASPPVLDGYSSVPVAVASDRTFRAVSMGNWHTCAVTSEGEALCWGANEYGQLGSPTAVCETIVGPLPCSATPLSVAGVELASIGGFDGHTCGLTATGYAYCWGHGESGQLGDGRSENSFAPVAVAGGHAFVALASDPSSQYACAIDGDSVTWCWGSGPPQHEGSSVPVAFDEERRFAKVVLAQPHACGLTEDGRAYCWGSNGYGQLGTGQDWHELPSSAAPVAVVGDHVFIDIGVGAFHTCALDDLGATWCWGSWGYFGDVSATEPTPLALAGIDPFASLTSGPLHLCGLTPDGAAWCWGANFFGQLGDGTLEHGGPVQVVGGLAFEALALGGGHTCGITTDGALYCWGSNGFGELGIGPSRVGLDKSGRGVVPFSLRPSRGGAVW